jgi:hypothetical protein
MTTIIVPPFTHDHNARPECGEHNHRLSAQGKASGSAGTKGHLRKARSGGNPLDKVQQAERRALNETSQSNVPTLVLRDGKARFVR